MSQKMFKYLREELSNLEQAGLYRQESVIESPQKAKINFWGGQKVINFCSSNYLGLANSDLAKEAAIKGIKKYGQGLSSNRMVCGTQEVHIALESDMANFMHTEECMLFDSTYCANLGLFNALCLNEDAIFYDSDSNLSLVDGAYHSQAQCYPYRTGDLNHLEDLLKRSKHHRFKIIATDGVFLTSGKIADLAGICELAGLYDAITIIDDSHGTGVLGESGVGSHEHLNVVEKIDVVASSFSHALGGVSGGFVAGKREIINWLRQKSRPYIFSNALGPSIASSVVSIIKWLKQEKVAREKIKSNIEYFKKELEDKNWEVLNFGHPIVSILTKDVAKTQQLIDYLYEKGVYALGLCYPLVPKNLASVRFQLTSQHSKADLNQAINALSQFNSN